MPDQQAHPARRLRALPRGYAVAWIGNAPRDCEVAPAGTRSGDWWIIAERAGDEWWWSPDDGQFESFEGAHLHAAMMNEEVFGE